MSWTTPKQVSGNSMTRRATVGLLLPALSRFPDNLRGFLALLEERESDQKRLSQQKSYLSRLMIKLANRVFLLKVSEIDWIEADGNYAKLHVGPKSHLLREKMQELESQLDPERFVRIHRSIIVNLDRIKEMYPHFNGDYIIVLNDGTRLKLSRSRPEHLEARLRVVS